MAYQSAMTNILEDIQNKLIFRAEAFVRKEIEGYRPTAADLDYPQKLLKHKPMPNTPESESGLGRSLILVNQHDEDGS